MKKELLEKLLKEKPSQNYEVKINFEKGTKITNLITAYEVLIMYAGQNRNGSYIAKNVAEDMASRLGGVPIVGIYNKEKGDFSMHTEVNVSSSEEDGVAIEVVKPTAYGYIPENAEVYWKEHLDKDGEIRKYLTTTAYLWDGRFEELRTLSQGLNNQSMELDNETLEWDFVDLGDEGVVFAITKADIIGLCILGKDVEPCFEGASFAPLFTSNSFEKEIDKMSAELKFALANYTLEEKDNGDEEGDIVVLVDKKDNDSGDLIEVDFQAETETEIENAEVDIEETETEEVETEEVEETKETIEIEEVEESEEVEEIEPTIEELQEIESEVEEVEEIEEILEDIDDIDNIVDMDEYNKVLNENKELKAKLEVFEAAELKKEKVAILKRFKKEMSAEDYAELSENLDDIDIKEVEKEAALKAYAFLKASLMEEDLSAQVIEEENEDEDEDFNFTLDTDPRSPILEDWQIAIKRKTDEQNS